MKLLLCSLYNSWDTLKNESSFSIVEDNNRIKKINILQGHYTLESLAQVIEEASKRLTYDISAKAYSPHGQLVITNHGLKPIKSDPNLGNLLNIGHDLKDLITFIKRIITPTAYFIHCDLIDRNNNLFNGKRSDLLAKFDVTGKPYEKVRYDTSLQFPFRDCSTDSHVNSITLSVRDQDGEPFDFKGMPIEFELEIN